MNKKRLLWLTPVILLFACRAWAEGLPWEMKLPFKEAIIHYEVTGSEKGTETLYVKDHGKQQARHSASTMTVMGRSQKTNTVQISDQDWVYLYNLVNKTGSKTINPTKVYQEEYDKLSAEEKINFEKNTRELGSGDMMMGQFGASVKQKGAQVLGYDCDVASIAGMSTVYVLHGSNILLRSETSVMGMNSVRAATKIETTGAIPDSAFAPPAGIEAVLDQQANEMIAVMVKKTVAALKKPDGAKEMQKAGPMGMMGGGIPKNTKERKTPGPASGRQ